MISLLKKLFAKKEDRPVAPWPFPTGNVKIETPIPVAEPVAEPVAKKSRAKKAVVSEPVSEPVAEPVAKKSRAKKNVVSEPIVDGAEPVAEPVAEPKPAVAAKSAPRKPRAKKSQ